MLIIVRRYEDAGRDGDYNDAQGATQFFEAEYERYYQHGAGSDCLDHLYEGNGKVDVRNVAGPQIDGKQDGDWENARYNLVPG